MTKTRRALIDTLTELRLHCDATEGLPVKDMTDAELVEEIQELRTIFDVDNQDDEA